MKTTFNKAANEGRIHQIMENTFDWSNQEQYGGLRMTVEDYHILIRSLETNLKMTCPSVGNDNVLDIFHDLTRKGSMGDFSLVKENVEEIITAFVAAEQGDKSLLTSLERRMQRKLDYMERHFSDAGEAREIPLHVYANLMDSEDNARRLQAAERIEYVDHVRGKVKSPKRSPN